jgi:hypothetical protein
MLKYLIIYNEKLEKTEEIKIFVIYLLQLI